MMETNNDNTKKMNKSTWLITAKTNLHVGDESSTGYGLIDKSVQRDALSKLPCINSSSLKGALNEFCCHAKKDAGSELFTPTQLFKIFGDYKPGLYDEVVDGNTKKKVRRDSQKGTTLFFDAGILFLPIQDDKTLYKLVTSKSVIDYFLKKANLLFDMNLTEPQLKEVLSSAGVHYEILGAKEEKEKEGNEKFIELCSDNELPIIARNVLENGESKNLWYEQVIPSETIFYTFLQSPEGVLERELEGKIVQIGANATIGYGYCKFTKIK